MTPFRPEISLDGAWSFAFNGEPLGEIQVPQPWEAAFPQLRERAGTGVYERSFTLPPDFQGKALDLHFGASDFYTEVSLNGVLIGTHEGGYTPFSLPIEGILRDFANQTKHTLRVAVTDSTNKEDATLPSGETLPFAEIPHGKQSWYTSVGGLWQSVKIVAHSPVYLERAHLLGDIDTGTVTTKITLQGGHRQNLTGWEIRLVVTPPNSALPCVDLRIPLPECDNESGELTLSEIFALPDFLLWSPQVPNLYTATLTLLNGTRTADVLTERFGMRKIEAKAGKIWLNGSPYFLIGVLDQDFYPQTIYTPPSEEFLRDQFLKAKEMGVNLMRCHIKVPDPRYLKLCDEIGLLVWYEIPNGKTLSQAYRKRAKETFLAMWKRDANHPSLVIASIINEAWGIDLSDAEQRAWLSDTYIWAKSLALPWLIVDNSPCIPNFHVQTDIDDYHIYYNIPDRAPEYNRWIQGFAEKTFQTYSPHGDGEYRGSEPLILSEFGNWGLPRWENVLACEGEAPWWQETGNGPVRPQGVLERFTEQGLERAFEDYATLADASQEQEWLSLKWEIEQMRLHSSIAGYVITEFTDLNWECNGLLDMARAPKTFHERLHHLQAQDILIPRLAPRTALFAGETATLKVHLSCFSGTQAKNATLRWRIKGTQLAGEALLSLNGTIGTSELAEIIFVAPEETAPTKRTIAITLQAPNGDEIAQTTQNIVFVPSFARNLGAGKTLWLPNSPKLAPALQALGYTLTTEAQPNALCLATHWNPKVEAFVQSGGKALLLIENLDALQGAEALGIQTHSRDENGWWGDWCGSKNWLNPEAFPLLPDTRHFDFEYQHVTPRFVLTGVPTEQTFAGLYVGWLHQPATTVAQLPLGAGNVVLSTYALFEALAYDPLAALILSDLAAL